NSVDQPPSSSAPKRSWAFQRVSEALLFCMRSIEFTASGVSIAGPPRVHCHSWPRKETSVFALVVQKLLQVKLAFPLRLFQRSSRPYVHSVSLVTEKR